MLTFPCVNCSAPIEVGGTPALGDFVLCRRCACWAKRGTVNGRPGWNPVTDPEWLTQPTVVEATIAGCDDDVPWFDPHDPRWWEHNPRFVALPDDEREAILAAAAGEVAYSLRSARLADGTTVWFTCGREPNLVAWDPAGLGDNLFRMLDDLDPAPLTEYGDEDARWMLAPLAGQYQAVACPGSWVLVQQVGGVWPWDDLTYQGPRLWAGRPAVVHA